MLDRRAGEAPDSALLGPGNRTLAPAGLLAPVAGHPTPPFVVTAVFAATATEPLPQPADRPHSGTPDTTILRHLHKGMGHWGTMEKETAEALKSDDDAEKERRSRAPASAPSKNCGGM